MNAMKMFAKYNKYNDRKVAKTIIGASDLINEVIISTMATGDVAPYETAIKNPRYNEGHWCIVEFYDDRNEAEKGHKRWVETFSSGKEDWPQGLISLN